MVLNWTPPFPSVTWYPRRNFCPLVSDWPAPPLISEYSPNASQCHISTTAPTMGVQVAPFTFDTVRFKRNGTPSFTAPLLGSDRMSDRLSLSSTKKGPSVRAGVTTQATGADVGLAVAALAAVA